MKELTGLKVKALAVEVPDGIEPVMGLIYGVRVLYFGGTKHIAFPPGTWTILGRANELTIGQRFSLVDMGSISAYTEIIERKWQSYCTANNLTNELILIKDESE
jgi:hypothetical protein